MVPDSLMVKGQFGFAAAQPFTGAAPQVVNGNPVAMNDVAVGSLSARVKALADTNTLTLTAKWQVFTKGGSWIDVANGTQNATAVAFATGTGGADVAVERVFTAPDAVYGYSRARLVITSGTGVGGGAGVDEIQALDYYYRRPWY